MKKTTLFIIFLLILSSGLSVISAAVIQSPPKDTDIAVNVYASDQPALIDGVVSDGEYTKLDIPQSSLSYVVGSESDWIRAKNTEFEAYASVCSKTFYFALTVQINDEYYITDCEPKYMWAQTALLLSFAKTGTTGRGALEIGIRPDGAYHVWQLYNGVTYSPENDFAAVYENGVITYEISVPLSAFGAENDTDFKFCFSISIGDYFNGERQTYVQFGKGISGFSEPSDADAGKDAAIFPTVKIIGNGEETTAPPEDITDPEIPDTGMDIKSVLILSAIAMAASLTIIHILLRKRKNSA